ncbi:hypothetical protein D3C73_1380580 [compost metagenome]
MALAHHAAGNDHRGVLLAANRFYRLILRVDHLFGRVDRKIGRRIYQQRFQFALAADKNDVDIAPFLGCRQSALNRTLRRMVSPHRVNRDSHA